MSTRGLIVEWCAVTVDLNKMLIFDTLISPLKKTESWLHHLIIPEKKPTFQPPRPFLRGCSDLSPLHPQWHVQVISAFNSANAREDYRNLFYVCVWSSCRAPCLTSSCTCSWGRCGCAGSCMMPSTWPCASQPLFSPPDSRKNRGKGSLHAGQSDGWPGWF